MNIGVEERVAVVTGGSSGIGYATVRLLLQEGAYVAFCGRNQDTLRRAEQALLAEFPAERLLAVSCDVLDLKQVAEFATKVQNRFGALDMLINNAGQGLVAHYADTARSAWLGEAELKLFGVLNPLEVFLPLLEQSDIASVTCVNSLLALQPEEHMIATSAARAALLNMTLTLSKSLIKRGVRINSILLGMVESDQWRRRFTQREDQTENWQQWSARLAEQRGIPMERLGLAEEAAHALLFLASPRSSYTTGAALDVSGGFNRHL